MKEWNLNFPVKLWCVTLCNFSRYDFVRYNDETETSNDEVNLPDKNEEPLDTGGEQRLQQLLNCFR
jgi:hypothetical protein